MIVKINEKEITLKKTFRSVIAYEAAMGKSFNPQTFSETIMYFFCTLLSSDQDVEITFDDFLGYLDDNPTALKEFTDWIMEQAEMESKLTKKKTVKTSKKEK